MNQIITYVYQDGHTIKRGHQVQLKKVNFIKFCSFFTFSRAVKDPFAKEKSVMTDLFKDTLREDSEGIMAQLLAGFELSTPGYESNALPLCCNRCPE